MGHEAYSFNPAESEELKLPESKKEETPKEIKSKLGAPSAKTGDVEVDLGPREKLFRATKKSKDAEAYRDYVGKSYGEENKKDKPIFQIAERLVEKEAEKKAEAIKNLKAKILSKMDESGAKITNDHFQKIPITPELRAVQKKAAERDVQDAYKKLVEAEDALAEAEKNRPGALSRFFSRFKIGKLPTEVSAYQAAFQDKSTPPEELKKLEAAAIEASSSKTSKAEIAYQQAIRAVEEAKNGIKEAEKVAVTFKDEKPKAKKAGMVRIGGATPSGGYVSSRVRAEITQKPQKAEIKPAEPTVERIAEPIAERPSEPSTKKPHIQAGEHKIVYKPEPAKPKQRVEVKLPAGERPEEVLNARQQLEKHIRDFYFRQDNNKELILKNAILIELLSDANFQGDARTLNKAILGAKEEILGLQKLKFEERLKLEGAKFDDLAEGGKLAKRLKAVFKKQPENYAQYLALEDLFEANSTAAGRAPKRPPRATAPVMRNW